MPHLPHFNSIITLKVEVISEEKISLIKLIKPNLNEPTFFLCDTKMNEKSFVNAGDDSQQELANFSELNSENCEMFIDNIKTPFEKYHIFDKEGIYTIKYVFAKKLTTCEKMFFGCKHIISIDLSQFNTEEVTDMSLMFLLCSNLENINFDNFKTSKVTNMEGMFENCVSLKSLNLSMFDTSNVVRMNAMFACCISLNELNISNFNTEKVIDMNNIFSIIGLEFLDLSSFSSKSLIFMNYMFKNSPNLKHIKFSKNFAPNNIFLMIGAFSNCVNLEKVECTQDLYDLFVEQQSSIYTLPNAKFVSIDDPKPELTEFKSQYHEHILNKEILHEKASCESCTLNYEDKEMFVCKECDFNMCPMCVKMEQKKGYLGLKGYLHQHEMKLHGNKEEYHCKKCDEIIQIKKGYYCEICDFAYCRKCTSNILFLAITNFHEDL